MLRILADENFNHIILRGLFKQNPQIDVIRVQDVGLKGVEDPKILEWCSQYGRILLTHDVRTMKKYAYERITQGLPTEGVFEVSQSANIGAVIQDLLLLDQCTIQDEWRGQILHIPLK